VFETLLKYHAWERQNFDDSTFPIPVKYVILCFQYYRLFFKQLDIICQDYSIEITQIQKDKGFFIWERENVALAVVAYHTVFISPPEIVEEESIGTNSPTKKIIFDEIETIDSSQGWRYAFSKEDDFLQFVELLTCYFEYRPYTIPQEIIKLKKNCKTRFAKVLQPIHKKLSEKALNSEVEFFELLRVLNHFNKSTDTEIYKCIIR
jgi:hypothetical protein